MAEIIITTEGFEEMRRAIARSPGKTLDAVGRFIIRGLSEYKKGIIRNPWRIGMSGGGAPVDTGNLRDTHVTETTSFEGRIYPTAPYAEKVHENRPWLDYVTINADGAIKEHQKVLLDSIVGDLKK